ncbi:LysR family transcriptional regulator [Cytophagaceae bacterium DM2B3-1]|uniref:LysR family transcriptional regulator n=1 Tax=Xanthocytophaga flava TaxID=3048013 RepID=A0ABT7CII9_9BACT|nr:LysR family transcriptional regulator [Xanthocytophaga flavus]MDJ1493545.1 LysR family transcriptional regulator [Xanthocytophaga flavus]
MTIYQLQNFLLVAETLSFRKAADEIPVAQPALTRQMQQLEEEVGAVLFDRTKRKIELTEAGRFFKQHIEKLLHQLEDVRYRTGQIHRGEAGEYRIGHASSAMQSVIPVLLKQMRKEAPQVKTMLIEASNRLICEKLLNNELDIGFMPNSIVPPALSSRVIYQENFALILPQSHPFSITGIVNLRDFCQEDWILPPQRESQGYVENILRIFQNHGFLPRTVHESPNSASVLRLVEAGIGITLMGKSTLKGIQLDIKYQELSNIPDKVEMRLVWAQERTVELSAFLELLKQFLPTPDHIRD